jgi:hypothetical protein
MPATSSSAISTLVYILSHVASYDVAWGQGKSLVLPYNCKSVYLSHSSYDVAGGQSKSLVPPYNRS